MRINKQTVPGVYEILTPDAPLPLVLDSPHSGTVFPEDFGFSCARSELELADERHVADLFSDAPHRGASLLCALFPRTYIDPNRAVDDLDPDMIAGGWDGPVCTTGRSYAGIGLIRRVLRPGIPVYDRLLNREEVHGRISRYYTPYHDALSSLLHQSVDAFGFVLHLNCHSMPSHVRPHRGRLAEIVLGDRDGTSCDPEVLQIVTALFRREGLSVVQNDPYRGMEILARHGRPDQGYHSLQIEINKSLYLNEKTGEVNQNYPHLKATIQRVIDAVAATLRDRLTSSPLAAD